MKSQQLTQLKVVTPSAPSNLAFALNAFLLDAEARRLTPKSILFYRQQLEPFLAYLETQGVIALEDLQAINIRSYLVGLQQRGLSDGSQHAAARSIRAFCNFAVSEELLGESPMRKVKMPRLNKEILPALEPDAVQRLLSVCRSPRDRAIVLCLLDTGCRAAEFVALNIGDLDLRTGAVLVRQGKGRKDRFTFLGTKARKALLKYLMSRPDAASDDALWLSVTSSERLTYYGLSLLLRRLGQQADVEHCNPHAFRRTCALWSLRAGMNIFALQQIMGHSDLSTLRRYLALVEEDLREAHRRYGAVDTML